MKRNRTKTKYDIADTKRVTATRNMFDCQRAPWNITTIVSKVAPRVWKMVQVKPRPQSVDQ